MRHHLRQWIGALALVLGVAACSASDIPFIGSVMSRDMTVADVPSQEETVRGDSDPPVVTLNLKSGLRERRLSASDEMRSDILVPSTNLNGVPVTAALQAVLSGSDVSLSWNTGALGSRLVTVMNLRGPLPKVIDKICSAARVFCSYRNGTIEMSEKETFVVSIPPVVRSIGSASAGSSSSSSSPSSSSSSGGSSNTTNSIVEAINKLLDGEKATVDEHGGNIIYTATVETEERVSRYLTELRTERPLIVLQMYIWEVTLNRENAQGINWSSFTTSKVPGLSKLTLANNLTSAASSKGSVSLGAVTTGVISASAIASFIATKGRVQTISNPQLTFVSGSTASLKVGGTQRYISEVGTSTSNVSGTSSSSTNSSTNTVSTDSIETGLAINVAGSYENGVVFANLDLSIKSLLDLGTTTSGGGTINLPTTADEKMNTVLRVRPGDSLVLAGYVTSSDSATAQGLPAGSESAVPMYGDDTHSNRELVIIVRPSIVVFSDKEEKAKDPDAPLEPVMIDKDGSRPLGDKLRYVPKLVPITTRKSDEDKDRGPEPVSSSDESSPAPAAAPVEPVSAETPPLPPPVPEVDPDAEPDFSHAFDKLLHPVGGGSSAEGASP